MEGCLEAARILMLLLITIAVVGVVVYFLLWPALRPVLEGLP